MTRRIMMAVLVLVMVSLPSVDAGPKSESKVKATATATKLDKDGKQTITITLDIEKSWYLYANPLNGNLYAKETLDGNRTQVVVKSKTKVDTTVKYPAGKFKKEIVGKYVAEFHIYQDQATVAIAVQRPADDAQPLEVIVLVNACKIDDKGKTSECLEQGTIKLIVP